MPVGGMHQVAPQQDAMNGAARQFDTFALQQNPQLARAPVGIALPQLHHSLFQLPRRQPRTAMRSPAALGQSSQTLLLVTLQPLATSRTRYAKLLTPRRE